MARTAGRALELLSLLQTANRWSGPELAERLGVSLRTVRRDIETLRELGYPVHAGGGRDSRYSLAAGRVLPPLTLDGEQAVAISLALQTSPTTVLGLRDAADRALHTLAQVMPAPLRAQVDATRVTTIRNYWEFPAPPIGPEVLNAVGDAVRKGHLLRIDVLRPDGSRPAPRDPDFEPPHVVQPHHLALWAARWYLVAWDPTAARPDQRSPEGDTADTPPRTRPRRAPEEASEASRDPAPVPEHTGWVVHRVDRLHAHDPTGRPFTRRDLPGGDVADFVMTRPDRGDLPAQWQCLGRATLALPAQVVARFAPGGSVIEALAPDRTRLTLGAWSWAGIAGILATFDTDVTDVEPRELREACATLASRFGRLA